MTGKTGHNKDRKSPRAVNKKAYRDYELLERFEAGLSLVGTEVKSLRAGQGDLDGSYARIQAGQCWLISGRIAPYAQAAADNHQPDRKRKLLLHKTEIKKIKTKLEQRGFTLVPLQIYFNEKNIAKIELALARGKRKYDKRRKIDERTHKRDIEKDMKKYHR